MKSNKKVAFTLIELISVISIIAILSAVLIPKITGYINRIKKNVVIDQCKILYRAIQLRKSEENFKFKDEENQIKDLFKENASFYNYDLIKEETVNKVLEVNLNDELTYISTESFELVIKNIEIYMTGKFIKLNK
ncbi:type II secretion system protein [Clostridium sp. D53t1_180928_C8]|uniref:type II secretion system protein n=1 Tax=Clostridium sp. D53t1_180928_C8 TaxID=2787101 RepID=UPI0018AC7B9D|nr:type II secretion system protein [Clostridium sp. D53t1_180928_C8]